MKICDRCGERPIALPLLDKKDGSEWDLCRSCKEAFHMFMASAEVKIYDGSEDKTHTRKCQHNRTQQTDMDGHKGPIICVDCGKQVQEEEISVPFVEPKRKAGRPKKNG